MLHHAFFFTKWLGSTIIDWLHVFWCLHDLGVDDLMVATAELVLLFNEQINDQLYTRAMRNRLVGGYEPLPSLDRYLVYPN